MTHELHKTPPRAVVFVLRNLALGGIPRVVIELSAAWTALYPADQVHIALLDDSARHYDPPASVRVHDLTRILNDPLGKAVRAGNRVAPNLFSAVSAGRNTRRVEQWRAQLERDLGQDVHLVFCGYGAISALMPRNIARSISVAHSLYAQMLRARTGRLAGANIRWLRHVLAGARCYGISTPIRDTLRQDVGIPAQTEVLFNPVDAAGIRLRAQNGEVPDAVGAQPYFLYLGRLSPEKNVDAILAGFAALPPDHDTQLVVAGDGPLRAGLEAKARARGINVVFLGAVKNPFPLIAGARALVLASDFEGLPTVLLEARALGTPIVTTPAQGTSLQAVEGYAPVKIVQELTPQAMGAALAHFAATDHRVSPDPLQRFSTAACVARYRKEIFANDD